jgi:hypothetical protein
MGRPSDDHEERREILDAVAVLAGFTTLFPSALPDGRRPDVMRLALTTGGVFLGDAKATESSGNSDTFARLLAYATWINAAARCDTHPIAVLALCVPAPLDAEGWTRALALVAHEVGLPSPLIELTDLGQCALVSCCSSFARAEPSRKRSSG